MSECDVCAAKIHTIFRWEKAGSSRIKPGAVYIGGVDVSFSTVKW